MQAARVRERGWPCLALPMRPTARRKPVADFAQRHAAVARLHLRRSAGMPGIERGSFANKLFHRRAKAALDAPVSHLTIYARSTHRVPVSLLRITDNLALLKVAQKSV